MIADIGGMFADLVSRVPGMENFLTAMKRPLRVATMCSGTESPLLALDKIGGRHGKTLWYASRRRPRVLVRDRTVQASIHRA